jgi:4-amino-4-deoxy-L-arabinose transferase-like glycosyltransferase
LLTWFVKTRFVRTPQDRHRNLAIVIGLVAVIVRLIAINQPFVDQWSWRQSDVASIARNYFQHGFQFAYPQIDWAGGQPGYVGTEFPILPFIAAISYKFTGVHEWVGRVQAVLLFAASLPFFFLLVREVFDARAATWATFFHSFAPLNIFAGRTFMPDVPSLSLSLIGLHFFLRWIKYEKSGSLFAAAGFISLSILIKLPMAIVGAPLFYLAWQKFRWRLFRQTVLWLFAAITLLPSIAWYWHAHAIAQRFYPHHFFGAGGIRIENFSWYWKIAKLIATSSLTPLLLVIALVGVFSARSTTAARLFHAWLFAVILFIIVVGYGNRHQWYQLPLVPIAAAFAGTACASIAPRSSQSLRVALSILVVVCFGSLSFVYARPFYRPQAEQLRVAGLELKRTTPPNSLIVAADNGDSAIFYYAQRKGWNFSEKDGIFQGDPLDSEQVIVDLEKLRQQGATHLVLTANTFWWLDYYRKFAEHVARTAVLVETNSQFQIYELRSQ